MLVRNGVIPWRRKKWERWSADKTWQIETESCIRIRTKSDLKSSIVSEIRNEKIELEIDANLDSAYDSKQRRSCDYLDWSERFSQSIEIIQQISHYRYSPLSLAS